MASHKHRGCVEKPLARAVSSSFVVIRFVAVLGGRARLHASRSIPANVQMGLMVLSLRHEKAASLTWAGQHLEHDAAAATTHFVKQPHAPGRPLLPKGSSGRPPS